MLANSSNKGKKAERKNANDQVKHTNLMNSVHRIANNLSRYSMGMGVIRV
jgi:hypothetical protein